MKPLAQLVILMIIAQFIEAQPYSQDSSFRTYYLDPITVTGTRTEVLRKHIPLSLSIINETEIKQSGDPSVLSLISSRVPGVFVTKRGLLGFGLAQGSAGQIYIRGTGSNPTTQVLVLLDGRPQFMGLMGHPLPDNYISGNVEKIEVVRGPCSFLYGSNAMGGVINIITKRQRKDGFSVNINQSFGSYSTLIGDAGVGMKKGLFDLYISATNQQSRGHRPYSEFNLNNGFLKSGYKLNRNFDITADANITKFKTYDPGTIYKPLIDNWVDILRGNAGFSIDNKFRRSDGSVKFAYNYGKHSIYDGFESEDKNINITAYQSAKFFKGSNISIGIDYKYYGGKAKNIKTSKDWGEHFVKEYAIYTQVQQNLFTFISVNGALRYEHNSVYGGEVIPQAGIAATLADWITIRASVSKGFRSPTIRELYLFPAPNPNLLPEKNMNYEIGILASPFSNFMVDIAAFYNKGDNLILTGGVYPNLVLSNSGEFEKKGIELSVKYIPSDLISINANYSYLDPDQQTMSAPWHKLFVESNLRYRFVGLKLSAEHVSKIYGDNFSRKQLENFTLLNARASYFYENYLSFYAEAENILNKEYQVIYGYPMPKATISIGLIFNN